MSGKCYFEIVPSRDREALLPIIYKRCLPESVIFRDEWSAYNDIARLDTRLSHFTVNHSLHFVAPDRVEIDNEEHKLHTNIGCNRAYLQAYIDEFCWRRYYERSKSVDMDREEKVFNALVHSLNNNFPVNSGNM